MKFNIGTKVKVKSKEWYDSTAQKNGFIMMPRDGKISSFTPGMVKFCGRVFTIGKISEPSAIYPQHYRFVEDGGAYVWIDDMIECEATPDEVETLTYSNGTTAPAQKSESTPVSAPVVETAPQTQHIVKENKPTVEKNDTITDASNNTNADIKDNTSNNTSVVKDEPVKTDAKTKKRKTQADVQATTPKHNTCRIELSGLKDSNMSLATALEIASKLNDAAVASYGENLECSIEYMSNGKVCRLTFN